MGETSEVCGFIFLDYRVFWSWDIVREIDSWRLEMALNGARWANFIRVNFRFLSFLLELFASLQI